MLKCTVQYRRLSVTKPTQTQKTDAMKYWEGTEG